MGILKHLVLNDSFLCSTAPEKEWHAGKTKIFMKETLENTLEQQRVKVLGTAAVFIQKHWRGAIARYVRASLIIIQ